MFGAGRGPARRLEQDSTPNTPRFAHPFPGRFIFIPYNQGGTDGMQRMHPPEAFEHHTTVYNYAERNGLTYVWEGTAAFEKRKRLLSPKQYQILAVHTRRGVTQVLLFSKDILESETSRHGAVADKRAQAWAKREARMKRALEEHRSRTRARAKQRQPLINKPGATCRAPAPFLTAVKE